jgi:hypothetical protein
MALAFIVALRAMPGGRAQEAEDPAQDSPAGDIVSPTPEPLGGSAGPAPA